MDESKKVDKDSESDSDVEGHIAKLWEYKNQLSLEESKSQESYDKTLIALSSGALGISFTLTQFFINRPYLTLQIALFISWTFWSLSLSAVLWSFFLSVQQHRTTINILDAEVPMLETIKHCNELHSKINNDPYSIWIRGFNAWGGIFFSLGVGTFSVFLISNIGG